MDRRASRLSRRQFVVGAVGAGLVVGCGRLPWQAEPPPPTRRPRIGYLVGSNSPSVVVPRLEAFRQGLRELGYVEGHTIDIELRSAEGDNEQLPGLAAELASLQVDILVTGGPVPTQAAKAVTTTIPIVMVVPDPVGAGFITTLARPGGNITGLSTLETRLSGKRLELLKEAAPTASRVAVLWNPVNPGMAQRWAETRDAADVLGVHLVSVDAQGQASVDDLFEVVARENANGLIVWSTNLTLTHAARVVDLATRRRLPTIYDQRDYVDAGGLMSYGADNVQTYRRAAYYVDRILKGTKPADLPVQQPMTFEFVVNLKTAQALGLTFPNEIMLQVTEVIQ